MGGMSQHHGAETPTITPSTRFASRWWVIGVAVVVVTGLMGGLVGALLGRQAERVADRAPGTDVINLPQQSPGSDPAQPGSVAALAEDVLPAVVSLRIQSGTQSASGSGFIIADEGYIITNNHVVELAANNPEASRIEVVFHDGRRTQAQITGRNVSYDLAVLSVEADGFVRNLPVLSWADDADVRVGDSVIAIGAPLGLAGTVTQGIVSALNRPVTTGQDRAEASYIDAIQTDASINPGNSGGPLLDGRGRVIGVNSAVATLAVGASGSIGVGFAIPASAAQRISTEIIATGASTTPIIGVTLDPFFPGPGALVEDVAPNSAAQNAGLQPGDVIIAVDGRPVADARTLIIAIRANAPGDTLDLTVRRGVNQFNAEVTLQARSDVP
jgi:putative serine protease PepD